MIQRCTNPNNQKYPEYGGRGIEVCDSWLPPKERGFTTFLKDMVDTHPSYFSGDPYLPTYFHAGVTLDRRNNAAGYNPENCRWGLREVQNLNRRRDKVGRNLPQGVRWRKERNTFQAYYMEGKKYVTLLSSRCLLDVVSARKSWELSRYLELGAV